jgi:Mg2+ and Co2+ transporter CorA
MAWLDVTYLRNSLITWKTQVAKMSRHVHDYSTEAKENPFDDVMVRTVSDPDEKDEVTWNQNAVGKRIQRRLDAIYEEYEDKIRDCSMRLDGMAMATQWSHSETAVEIALATNRESRVMKSISLVTMIFLPGTFFAVSHDPAMQPRRNLLIHIARLSSQ